MNLKQATDLFHLSRRKRNNVFPRFTRLFLFPFATLGMVLSNTVYKNYGIIAYGHSQTW